MTFDGLEKIISLIDRSSGKDVFLNQVGLEELREIGLRGQPPRNFAVTNMHSDSVDIEYDCEATTEFNLYAQGIESRSTLSGNDSPDFPESFHDILIFGAMADEYRKMEKVQFYHDAEADFERRLSDLRMFIAKSAYMDITQGKFFDQSKKWLGIPRFIG